MSNIMHDRTPSKANISVKTHETPELAKFLSIVLCVTSLKFLLMPSYHSTDFDVHRNWLSITHNLPLSQWYRESTNEWTLDYPPLFAWFEWFLSQFASYFDSNMLRITGDTYLSEPTKTYQRLTVIITDLVYYYACFEWLSIITKLKRFSYNHNFVFDEWFDPQVIVSMLFLWNPGLLIVDHIHFQYNGLLSGLMMLSLARMMQNRPLESAFWFAILLNMKHIYIYIAPAYFVYLLRSYCLDRRLRLRTNNFIKLSLVVSTVFIISFAPFIVTSQLTQVIARLFPFKRGLTHAYWAPNFWALYNSIDKGLSLLISKEHSNASMTSGLVKEYDHLVLYNITPTFTMICVVVAILPSLISLWNKSHQNLSQLLFIQTVIICAFSSYLFGWHVHEKAILLIILPLTPLAMTTKDNAKVFNILSTVGYFSLFPLLFKEAETLTKILLLLIYCVYSYKSLETLHYSNTNKLNTFCIQLFTEYPSKLLIPLPFMNVIESLYLIGLIGLQFIYSFSNLFEFGRKYPFIPLMLISTYCSLGAIYCFVLMLKNSFKIKLI